MSVVGQSRHFDRAPLTSGFPRLADIARIGLACPKRANGDSRRESELMQRVRFMSWT